MENKFPIYWINFGVVPDARFFDETQYASGPYCRGSSGSHCDFEVWGLKGVIGKDVVEIDCPTAEPYFYIYPSTRDGTLLPFITDGSKYAWPFHDEDPTNLPKFFDEIDHQRILAAIKTYRIQFN
jgi:hypothetical protein